MYQENSTFSGDRFHRAILDAVPCPILVVEEDVRIVDFNPAAGALLQQERTVILRQRAGQVLHCIHSLETPGGCGRAPACSDCPVRNGVNQALAGQTPPRQTVKLELVAGDNVTEALFLISVTPLAFQEKAFALVVLEDVREITLLRQMLPICSRCKQVRNDANFWQSVETYLSAHLDIACTHSLCPECAEQLFPEYAKNLGAGDPPPARPTLTITPTPPDAP